MDMWDKSPPQNKAIVFYGILAVVILAALKPAFDSYYDSMYDNAVNDRRATHSDRAALDESRARWDRELGEGRLPIDRAMEQLGSRGRSAFPAIRPQAAESTDAMRGWSELPQEVNLPEPTPVVPEPFFEPGDTISPDVLEGLEEAVEGGAPEGAEEAAPEEAAPETEETEDGE